MKTFFTLSFLVSFGVFAANERSSSLPGRFTGCEKKEDQCITEACEKHEIMDHENGLPILKCRKVSRKDPKSGAYVFMWYEIGVQFGLPAKTKEECGGKECAYDYPSTFFRVR